MKTASHIAKKIKKARKDSGLSQLQLGKALKLSDKAISSYEVGRAVPSVEVLQEISRVTYKPVSYFLDDRDAEEMELEMKLAKIERELSEVKRLLARRSK
jgi:transcriptional regulator with XRE-family HTH domain